MVSLKDFALCGGSTICSFIGSKIANSFFCPRSNESNPSTKTFNQSFSVLVELLNHALELFTDGLLVRFVFPLGGLFVPLWTLHGSSQVVY